MDYDLDVRRFGLGHTFLTTQHELAILAEMAWDGEVMPYPLVRAWFEQTLAGALEAVVARSEPTGEQVFALTERTYIKSGVPEKLPSLVV